MAENQPNVPLAPPPEMLALKADLLMPIISKGLEIRARVARATYDAFIAQKFSKQEAMQFTRDYLVEFAALSNKPPEQK